MASWFRARSRSTPSRRSSRPSSRAAAKSRPRPTSRETTTIDPQTRKQRTRRLLAACIAAAATVLAGALLIEGAASTVKSASEGACAALRPNPLSANLRALVPDFELPDLTGKKVSLRSLLGHPVLGQLLRYLVPALCRGSAIAGGVGRAPR
jgi:hypothetical protein